MISIPDNHHNTSVPSALSCQASFNIPPTATTAAAQPSALHNNALPPLPPPPLPVIHQLQTQLFSALSQENEILRQRLLKAERVRIDDQNDADAIRFRSALSTLAHTIGIL
jgi:hypothetical protein